MLFLVLLDMHKFTLCASLKVDAIPVGWKRGSMETDQQTQGVSIFLFCYVSFIIASFYSNSYISCTHFFAKIRIELPFEQAVSTSIDTNTMMKTFSIRRTALIWNSRGILVFPGGMGTVNELFEAWTGAIDHKVACPIVIIPHTFYKPFLDAIKRVAVIERKLIAESDFNLVVYANDEDAAVELIQQPMRPKDPGTQFTLREKLIYLRHELGRGLATVSSLCPAVVFMGSRYSLSRTDAEVQYFDYNIAWN